MMKRKKQLNTIIDYIVVGPEGSKVMKISLAGLRKIIQKEIKEKQRILSNISSPLEEDD